MIKVLQKGGNSENMMRAQDTVSLMVYRWVVKIDA